MKVISKKSIFTIILSLIIFSTIMLIGNIKSGYHVDEIYTFGLSNHQYNGSIIPDIEEDRIYSGEELWSSYTTVSEEHRFDYKNVFINQKHDVHPPLYYALIHTICSLFPEEFSKWTALLINAFLAIVIFWQIVWLFNHFLSDKKWSFIFGILFLFCMGSINNILFFRMYVLLTVLFNFLAIFFCKYTPENTQKSQYPLLAIIILLGVLTQYYFGIFCFFTCLIYAIYLIIDKNWKKIKLYFITLFIAATSSLLIFPPMINHIFFGYRGVNSIDISGTVSVIEKIEIYYQIFNKEIFGGLFIILICFSILLLLFSHINNPNKLNLFQHKSFLQIAIPTLLYVLTIVIISPYQTDRYVFSIMGLVYVCVFIPLILLCKKYFPKLSFITIGLALLMTLSSFRYGIPNAHLEELNKQKILKEKSEIPCIYIYDSNNLWEVTYNLFELKNLNSIVFIDANNVEKLSSTEFNQYDSLIVYSSSTVNMDNIISFLIGNNKLLTNATTLFPSSNVRIIYLE